MDAAEPAPASQVPHLTLPALFLRFLRFGAVAWGGPVAQIGMLQKELVEEERWVPMERFHRALAVYQVLPGPEAHEMCVWFGMLARGRAGAVVAGLGFMLPGFVLMLALSALYVRFGLAWTGAAALLTGLNAAVVALVVRALHRIALHAATNARLVAIAVLACTAELLRVPFAVTLALAAGANALVVDGRRARAVAASAALVAAGVLAFHHLRAPAEEAAAVGAPGVAELFLRGLRAGLLTFGGAYTAIPFLRHDAVVERAWMTDAQFLDGIALGGVLPAPLIIFSTFVGHLARGLAGAFAMTAGVFLPAFGFTLLGHGPLERLTSSERLRPALAGVVAAVAGIVAATAIGLFRSGVTSAAGAAIFATALAALYLTKSRAAVPFVVLGGGAAGYLFAR